MFVDIEDFKGAIAVENILAPYKKGRVVNGKRLPKEPITPQVCMEILKSTNYARNIKDMLQCVAELPQSEQAQFKDVVIATFDNREQPNDILVLGKKLAVAHGFEKELSEVLKLKDGDYLSSSSQVSRVCVTSDPMLKRVKFSSSSNYSKLICLSDQSIILDGAVNVPPILEIPHTVEVRLGFDWSGLKSLTVNENATINLSYASGLPEHFEIEKCAKICVGPENLETIIKGWKYPQDTLTFNSRDYYVVEADKIADLSAYSYVDLVETDLSDVPNMRLKDGVKASFSGCSGFREDFDFTAMAEAELIKCDFSSVDKLKFRDGADVTLWMDTHLPPVVDVSNCAKIIIARLKDCSRMEKIIFKNKAQMENNNVELPKNWRGKVVFAENSRSSLFNDSHAGLKRWVGKLFGKGGR